jgi:hypothetical protein
MWVIGGVDPQGDYIIGPSSLCYYDIDSNTWQATLGNTTTAASDIASLVYQGYSSTAYFYNTKAIAFDNKVML